MTDPGHLDYVEGQLNRLIEDRARTAQAKRAREELWAASVRKYNLSRDRERRAQWAGYHTARASRLERTAAELAASHRAKAEALLAENLEDAGRGEGVR